MKEGGTASVGGTSWNYHNAPTGDSLAANFHKSNRLRSAAIRNLKLHQQLLVTDPEEILAVPSKKRARQTFDTKDGETLHFDEPKDLKRIARISAVRGLKELTRQRRLIDELDPATSESESEPDDHHVYIDSGAESEEEAD